MTSYPKNAGLIDKYFVYPIANIFLKPSYKLGLTPNIITTITLVLRIIYLYNFYNKKNPGLIISLSLITWITDALDGAMARKYDMKSEFGSYYDVVVDNLTSVLIVIILLTRYLKSHKKIIIMLFIVELLILFLIMIKLSCNKEKGLKFWEKMIRNNTSSSKLCKYKFINYVDPGIIYFVYSIFLTIIIYS